MGGVIAACSGAPKVLPCTEGHEADRHSYQCSTPPHIKTERIKTMYNISMSVSNGPQLPPSHAYREAEQGVRKAVQQKTPVLIGFEVDGKSYQYDVSTPHGRACAAVWAESLNTALKDLEPEEYVARASILKVLDITGARRFSHIDPVEGTPLNTVPGDPYYEAEAQLRERLGKQIIGEYALALPVLHERTFCQGTESINPTELRAYEYALDMVGWAMRMSRIHPDELRHWMFASGKDAPFKGCHEDLQKRLTAVLRTIPT